MGRNCSLVIKALAYEAKAETLLKAKGQLPLRAKICIAVTDTEYAYLIKHNAKESICGRFTVFNVENYSKNNVLPFL